MKSFGVGADVDDSSMTIFGDSTPEVMFTFCVLLAVPQSSANAQWAARMDRKGA
ncbi:hypothetical protein E4U25_000964 [Claviceps purpurea]|nr:hypothetical protein E4U25_000964 [Claviceps purpurea]